MKLKIKFFRIKILYSLVSLIHAIFNKNSFIRDKKISLGAILIILISLNTSCTGQQDNDKYRLTCYEPVADTSRLSKDSSLKSDSLQTNKSTADSTIKKTPLRPCYQKPLPKCYKKTIEKNKDNSNEK